LLVRKAQFKPEAAVAIAEAIDMAIINAEVVTVPLLDGRLATVRAELKGDIAALRAELKGDIAALRAELKDDIAQLRVELKDMKGELMRWVLLTMVGSSALSAAASALVRNLG